MKQALVKERIIMLDIGRKYFSPKTLRQLMKQMALCGFNYLQLHFSENEGFRIESHLYPELVSEQFLTCDEVQELIEYAADLSIEIIPDLDTPGHMAQLLKGKPEWQLSRKTPNGENQKVVSALDITNEEAVQFTLSLYEEYTKLFSKSHYFHIGADEFIDFEQFENYPALAQDGLMKFENYVNKVAEFVRERGFTPRVWNDAFFRNGGESKLSQNIEITYWTKWHKNMAPIQTFLNKDFSVLNFNDNYLYYVLGENAGYSYPKAEKIKNGWHPKLFASNQLVTEKEMEQVKGVALAVWCDYPNAKSEKEILEDLSELMRSLSIHFNE
ncbi:family 20 glycosylhydrolase [Enterococcus rivorum]|uniref:Glycoside hydrolase family 20 catalytic domain-containing protein n=1 Tax=Enterococcus rivorum TaxID=762845 RepID=A0A1E5L1W4_9ENTE|nr:family 20 glycosylhydrolase [Enterococcus rivorum]MBP2097833.1 hexosaminidase [Enterococcus rivorum]OEH84094.1 hypothetical protein BCR26_01085 [Enterococcus rivorum]